MTGYQSGIHDFESHDVQVFGISTDNTPSLRAFAEQQKLSYPLLSDFMRKVSAEYGVLNEKNGMDNRTTFVIDKEGKIQHIEEGPSAIDPTGALTACKRIKK